ncbi:MAG: NADH-quinone oxidoreductase subunit J [Firmicutes bacterium]|nr:NADH-quinone oxidoreductase subunit J [Bacillota bacterium]
MFLIFALITLVGALMTFSMRNLVMAGLSLVLCFIGVAGLFLLLANPVAAALQMVVYSGAIVVLVLFVIMLLASHEEEEPKRSRPIQRWGSVAAIIALGPGAVLLVKSSPFLASSQVAPPMEVMTLHRLGGLLFKEHLVAFEIAGLLLLAAMIAAVSLVKREL